MEKLQGSMEAQKRELEEIRNELAEKAKAASQFESELKGSLYYLYEKHEFYIYWS